MAVAPKTTGKQPKYPVEEPASQGNFEELYERETALNERVTEVEEAQASDGKMKFTAEGGLAVQMVNNTGAASVKGTLVEASPGINEGVILTTLDSVVPCGAVYEDGVADGELMYVAIAGIVEVLLEDTLAGVRANWCDTSSNQTGRMDQHAGPTPATHWQEIGHCLENKTAGTDVLCKITMHFL